MIEVPVVMHVTSGKEVRAWQLLLPVHVSEKL
jgi:hypothetical protein